MTNKIDVGRFPALQEWIDDIYDGGSTVPSRKIVCSQAVFTKLSELWADTPKKREFIKNHLDPWENYGDESLIEEDEMEDTREAKQSAVMSRIQSNEPRAEQGSTMSRFFSKKEKHSG